ncbi:MAG: glycoside hydrolase family 104 protein [Prochlorococcaceae cyanobacterium]
MRQLPQLLLSSGLLLVPLVPATHSERQKQAMPSAPPLATNRAERPSEQPWLAPFAVTPERKALLNTIRFAEGTWRGGSADGYRMIYGGQLVSCLKVHPDRVVVRRYASAAAGAYQFMPDTWQAAAGSLKLKGFGPANQDQAALYLVKRSGALEAIDRGQLTPELMARLAPTWASFPDRSGASVYGQPVRRGDELARFYASNLQQIRATS